MVSGWFRQLPRWVQAYGMAFGLSTAAELAQVAVHQWIGNEMPFIFMMPTVCLAAVMLGRGPALLVVAVGAMNAMLLYPPVGSLRVSAAGDAIAVTIFILLAVIIAFYGGRTRLVTPRADEKLLQERRFTVAIDSAVVPFNLADPVYDDHGRLIDMRFVYLNPAGARLMGRPVNELIGRRFTEVLPTFWHRPGLLERYASVIATNESQQFELTSTEHNPGLWFNVIMSPVNGSLAVWFEDITERKRQEKAQAEADQRKDEFLATLAHELRNPLAPIRQGVRVARSTSATEAQIRWCHEVIERQVKHMALLLDDLLDVSRISRGTLLLRRSRVALAGVMEAALEVARPHIEAKRHHLDLRMPEMPVTVDLDPMRIAQVVGNLLTNAAKYTDSNGRITVDTAIRGDELVIRITDTGIGLTAEQMLQLFEMFAQAPAAIGRSQGGLGIGLALARRLVKLHGGEIEVQSAGVGCGSEFTVRLPGCVTDSHDSTVAGETLRI